MEQIIECYGRFLLDACAVVLLLLLIFGLSGPEGPQGVLNMIGRHLPEVGSDGPYSYDFDEFICESRREAPLIIYTKRGPVSAGSWFLSDLVKAYDASGKELPVRIQAVRDPDGTEIIEEWDRETTGLDFAKAGIYSFTVSASDALRKKSVCVIRIPVNM